MSIEIKLRAWTGSKMVYAELSSIIWSMGHQCAEDVSLEEEVGEELSAFQDEETEKTIMQFIGAQDNSGKDIYTGDTATYFNRTGIIQFDNDRCAFVLYSPEDRHSLSIDKFLLRNLKITGNIYQ